MAALIRNTLGHLLGCSAAALETGAMLGLYAQGFGLSVAQASLGHAAATLLCLCAAEVLRPLPRPASAEQRARRSVERDLLLATAAFVPLFGPALAWRFLLAKRDDELDAHAWFEKQAHNHAERRVMAIAPKDDHDTVPHDVMSFSEVLRRGTLDHKRNALRKLAERGTPRHLGMLRNALYSDNAELRLCAYGELQTLARGHEERLADLQRELGELADQDRDARHRLLTEAAAAHQSYAASGLLDPEMRRYHLQCAVRYAEEAWLAAPQQWRIATVYALTLSDLGDHEHARGAFAQVPAGDQERPEVCIAQAEIAFRQRDFVAVRHAGERLERQRLRPPEWLAALCDQRRPLAGRANAATAPAQPPAGVSAAPAASGAAFGGMA